MGADAVLSLQQASRLLPLGDRAARAWLRDEGLVRRIQGREVVVWGDVLNRIREDEETPAAAAVSRGRVRLPMDP